MYTMKKFVDDKKELSFSEVLEDSTVVVTSVNDGI